MAENAALVSLNIDRQRRRAVLRRRTGALEPRILQNQDSGGVHAPLHIRIIVSVRRFSKQSHYEMNIIDVQIQQCPARLIHIEHRRDDSLLERVIAAGILRKINLYNFDIPEAGKQLPYLFIVGIVLVRDSLKEKQALAFRQLRQLLCLRIGHRKGLLHDQMLSRLQRLLREAVMQAVWQRQIQHVQRFIRQQLLIAVISRRDMVFFAELLSLLFFSCEQSPYLHLRNQLRRLQKPGYRHARSCNSYSHVLLSSCCL